MKLFCKLTDNAFEWSDDIQLLPANCVGCPYTLCYQAMRERVRDNVDGKQLEFDFGN